METLTTGLYVFILVFLSIAFLSNVIGIHFPKLPGDVYFDKPGFQVYIPFTTAIIISIVLLLVFSNLFKR